MAVKPPTRFGSLSKFLWAAGPRPASGLTANTPLTSSDSIHTFERIPERCILKVVKRYMQTALARIFREFRNVSSDADIFSWGQLFKAGLALTLG